MADCHPGVVATCKIFPPGLLEKYSSRQKTYWGRFLNDGHTNGLTKVPRQGQILSTVAIGINLEPYLVS